MLLPSAPALLMATNHWSVSIGSMTTPVRSPRGTFSLDAASTHVQDQALLFEVGDDLPARGEAIHALIANRRIVVDLRVERQDRDHRQLVTLADGVVVEVVRRGDLDTAGAKGEVNVGVSDDRNLALAKRQFDHLAEQVR
jgi:hypothetical protein